MYYLVHILVRFPVISSHFFIIYYLMLPILYLPIIIIVILRDF